VVGIGFEGEGVHGEYCKRGWVTWHLFALEVCFRNRNTRFMDNDEVLKIIKWAQKNQKHLTHIKIKDELSDEERLKMSLCRHFVQYVNEHRITIFALAKKLGVSKMRATEIANYKISNLTADELQELLARLK